MTAEANSRGRYFREISRAFLCRRGAPFFLSAKDVALIADWEKEGLPLGVVLEGIERCFEKSGRGPAVRGKVLSLAFCERPVRRAYDQLRDRRIGGRPDEAAPLRPGKREAALAAVEDFLARPSPEAGFLRDVFIEARRILGGATPSGGDLEKLDEKTDALLLETATDADREEAGRSARALPRGLPFPERSAAEGTFLVKGRREKLRVPYVSSFYY
jgi:hypothetical protein